MSPRLFAGVAGAAAAVAAVTLLARVTGFGRWLVFHGAVGAECVGDAYTTANQIPNVLYEVVAGGALAAAVVPLLAGPLARGDHAEVARTASALLTWAVAVLVPVALVLGLLAGPLAGVLLGGQECDGQRALVARMLVVFAPQVVLYGVGVVLTGVLQAHRRFLWAAVAPLLSSAVVIVAYVAFAGLAGGSVGAAAADLDGGAEAALAWGTTAGVAALTLPLLVPVLAGGVRLRPTWRFPPGVARRAAALAGAGVVTLLAQQAAVVVALLLANGAGPQGSWTVFLYVQAVYLLPYAVLAVPVATVAFPRLAEHAAAGRQGAFAATAATTTRAVVLVALLGAAVLAATAPAVTGVFAGIGSGDVTPMTSALVAIAPGLVGFALVAHLGRALNALHRPRAAALATAAGWAAVVAGSLVAVAVATPAGTVAALGAGSSVGMTVAGVLLLLAVSRAAGGAAVAGVARTVAAGGATAVLAAVAGRLVVDATLDALPTGGVVAAVLAGTVGVVVVLAALAAGLAAVDRPTALAAVALLRRRPPVGPVRSGTGSQGAS